MLKEAHRGGEGCQARAAAAERGATQAEANGAADEARSRQHESEDCDGGETVAHGPASAGVLQATRRTL